MSAGAFINSRYLASYGAGTQVHPIRVQAETLAATAGGVTNSPPSGASLTSPISAVSSQSRRSKGLKPRTVTLKAPSSSPPAGYLPNGVTTIPALVPAFYIACSAVGTEVTYLGSTFTVVGISPEVVK